MLRGKNGNKMPAASYHGEITEERTLPTVPKPLAYLLSVTGAAGIRILMVKGVGPSVASGYALMFLVVALGLIHRVF